MAHWPLTTGPQVDSSVARTTSRINYKAVTASGTIHTKGAWAEIIASLAHPATRMIISAGSTFVAAANSSSLLDIGIGAAGAEQVLLANLAAGYAESVILAPHFYDLPFFLPAGTRIAARLQSVAASKVCNVHIDAYGGMPVEGGSPYRAFETFGADTAASKGQVLTAGAANVAGAWAVVSASTPNPIAAMFVGVQGNASTNMTNGDALIEIGVGASGSEVVVASGIYMRLSASELVYTPTGGVFPRPLRIPAGSRLVARLTSTVASQTLDCTFHGMR